jgi:hypothetical protein
VAPEDCPPNEAFRAVTSKSGTSAASSTGRYLAAPTDRRDGFRLTILVAMPCVWRGAVSFACAMVGARTEGYRPTTVSLFRLRSSPLVETSAGHNAVERARSVDSDPRSE